MGDMVSEYGYNEHYCSSPGMDCTKCCAAFGPGETYYTKSCWRGRIRVCQPCLDAQEHDEDGHPPIEDRYGPGSFGWMPLSDSGKLEAASDW